MATVDEIKSLALIVKSSFDGQAAGEVARLAERWDLERIAMLAARHRVEGLAWDGLLHAGVAIPPAASRQLQAKAQEIASQHLVNLACCVELHRALEDGSISHCFLKGRPLAALVYSRPQVKDSCDIDLLVEPENLMGAAAVLRSLGFQPSLPGQVDALPRWHGRRKESVWIDAKRDIQVDLHTHPIDNCDLAPSLCELPALQGVSVGHGWTLPLFTNPSLFAYLCVHGASSAWFRLTWLADLAALLRDEPPERIAALHGDAVRIGAGRASGQALLLLDRLFGTALPLTLKDRLHSDRAVRILLRVAWRQLTNDEEPTDRRTGTMTIRASQLLLGGSLGYAIREFWRQGTEIVSRP